jgi:hypothetical protein
MEEYLTDVARRVRTKTHRRYEDLYHCHIEGTEVGEKKLRELTPDDVRALYADRLAAGYALRTVEHLHVFLKTAIQQVVEAGLAPRNPVASVKLLRGSKKDIRPQGRCGSSLESPQKTVTRLCTWLPSLQDSGAENYSGSCGRT